MNHQTHQILFTLNLFFVLHYQMKWSALFYLIKLNWRNHFENLLVHNQQIKVYKSKKSEFVYLKEIMRHSIENKKIKKKYYKK